MPDIEKHPVYPVVFDAYWEQFKASESNNWKISSFEISHPKNKGDAELVANYSPKVIDSFNRFSELLDKVRPELRSKLQERFLLEMGGSGHALSYVEFGSSIGSDGNDMGLANTSKAHISLPYSLGAQAVIPTQLGIADDRPLDLKPALKLCLSIAESFNTELATEPDNKILPERINQVVIPFAQQTHKKIYASGVDLESFAEGLKEIGSAKLYGASEIGIFPGLIKIAKPQDPTLASLLYKRYAENLPSLEVQKKSLAERNLSFLSLARRADAIGQRRLSEEYGPLVKLLGELYNEWKASNNPQTFIHLMVTYDVLIGALAENAQPQKVATEAAKNIITEFNTKLSAKNASRGQPDENAELITQAKGKFQALSGEVSKVAGLPVNAHDKGQGSFDALGSINLLSQSKDNLTNLASDTAQLRDYCLRMGYLVQDIDQALRNAQPDELRASLVNLLKTTAEDGKINPRVMKDLKVHFPGLSFENSTPELFAALVQQIPDDLLSEQTAKLLGTTVKSLGDACFKYFNDFFAKNLNTAYQKNWVHLQKALMAQDIRNGSMASLGELTNLTIRGQNLKRSSADERSLAPHLFDLSETSISYYAKKDKVGLKKYTGELKTLIKNSDLSDQERIKELKRLSIAYASRANDENKEEFVGLLETFFEKMSYAERLEMTRWYTKLLENYKIKDSTMRKNFDELILHAQSRLDLSSPNEVLVQDPSIGDRYTQILNGFGEIKNSARMKDFELRSLIKAARNTLFFNLDSDVKRKFLDLLLNSESEFLTNASQATKQELREYLSLSMLSWNKSDNTFDGLKKYFPNAGILDSEYEANLKKSNALLDKLGQGPINPQFNDF